ncbi:MAG: hypothetical protein ACF8R7_13350 [Phycisphaerales bacterium JB039]
MSAPEPSRPLPAPSPGPSDAPPTQAPPPAPAPTTWPGVLGTIAIVLGALGAFGAVIGFAAAVGLPRLLAGILPAEAVAAMQAGALHPAAMAALQGASALVAILLLVSGVRLVQRRQSGAMLLRRWALLKIVLVVVSAAVGAIMTRSQFAAMQATAPGGPPPGFQAAMALVGAGFGVLWGWALPIFSLVWLGRAKIRSEIDGWAP